MVAFTRSISFGVALYPLRCACLVAEKDGNLLLVRVRQNEHWYLPGGKIEDAESPEEALHRELDEELGISITPGSLGYLYSVVGPAYGQTGEVELICFSASFAQEPRPHGEISAVDWLSCDDHSRFAPAVQILCTSFLYSGELQLPAAAAATELGRYIPNNAPPHR